MKLGARIFKTGLAVMLSLYLAIWLGLEPPMFAALASAIAVQPSLYRTFQTILEQIQANIIGAFLAVIFVMTFGHDPFVVGLVVVLAISIILKVKLEPTTIPLAIMTVIVIMESPADDFILFAAGRFGLILIGVLAAFIINLLFLPPKYETKLYHKLLSATEDINQWTMLLIRHAADHRALKKDLNRLEEKMVKLENIYLLYKEERNYFMKNKYGKARKVVLYRQMLVTAKKALFVLKNLEKRTEELNLLPEETHQKFEKQLQYLTSYHDRILLRYIGRTHTNHSDELIEKMNAGKEELMSYYISLQTQPCIDYNQWLHLLPAVSQMIEYQEQLEHLDHLVESFFTYHQEENEVKIREREED
ncbi:putative lipoprotein SAV1865 [Halalkalibacter wakoensis JCM 9140]|uniref:Putative lipoprotein SAV1865 n=1 Tax=Halalkalibacter wakoensis JCM 9140 TaxID=1236970 RepID=W4Q2U3_9BACI|nr:aromatic acid exporter family protein [Halalkalibacter wakoensis]GAE26396.1 putative lipoprotein SAV1865 [Halalkalibacter wakoensis JCM 9140]